jgi:NADH-quinone oxidoreductase subunit L
MMNQQLLFAVLAPLLASLGSLLFCSTRLDLLGRIYLVAVTALNLALTLPLFGTEAVFSMDWSAIAPFLLKLDPLSSLALAAGGVFALLAAIFTIGNMASHPRSHFFYFFYLLTIGFYNGAVLADHLVLMLFFWASLLATLYGMIYVGGSEKSFRTANKAVTVGGIADLFLIVGVALTAIAAGGSQMSQISLSFGGASDGMVSLAFIMMLLGAVGKAGSMPFHSWIPDAATDAPLPFMVLVASALEKLLGIYLVARMTLYLFQMNSTSWLSPVMMMIGGVTLILATLMAVGQQDYRRVLAFQSIGQVGLMVLAFGTFTPVGVVGGLFHLVNHVTYKSGLFMVGGIIEKRRGTMKLDELGGLGRQMPLVFVFFIILALANCGVPPLNAFFSKELMFDALLAHDPVYYIVALVGSFLTIVAFLKLAHATFLGAGRELNNSQEAKKGFALMMLPVVVLAAVSLFFGLDNAFAVKNLILPVKPDFFAGEHHFYGMPGNMMLVGLTLVVIALGFISHIMGVKVHGSGFRAADHFTTRFGMGLVHKLGDKGFFDPYEWIVKLVQLIGVLASVIDGFVSTFYDKVVLRITSIVSKLIRALHNGSHVTYLVWAGVGACVLIAYVMGGN